jgi:membrane-bound lytic murein transglycosylase D
MAAGGGSVLLLGSLTALAVMRERPPGTEAPPVEQFLEEVAAAPELNPLEWDLTVTHNERVQFWIDFLAGRNAERTQLWLERQGRYGPMIRQALRERGMPEDLIYLALIESGFSTRAYSRAHAVGIWQFIEETGRRHGLEVSPYVDERRDPVKSTHAALAYLTTLHRRFDSWYLAAAGYNTGENRVGRILREMTGSEKASDEKYWLISPRLPRETRDYVPLMLAAGHIAKEPEKYGFERLEYQEPLRFELVQVPGGTPLSLVARAANASAQEVEDLNPHLLRKQTPPGRTWEVRLPVGHRQLFAQNFERVRGETLRVQPDPQLATASAASVAAGTASARHTVRRGETLGHIAQRYGTTVSALRAANGGVDPRRLQAGQQLRLPGTASASAPARVQQASSASARIHQVRRGDTLSGIAQRYGVTVRQLQAWNAMGRQTRIVPGQRLRLGS